MIRCRPPTLRTQSPAKAPAKSRMRATFAKGRRDDRATQSAYPAMSRCGLGDPQALGQELNADYACTPSRWCSTPTDSRLVQRRQRDSARPSSRDGLAGLQDLREEMSMTRRGRPRRTAAVSRRLASLGRDLRFQNAGEEGQIRWCCTAGPVRTSPTCWGVRRQGGHARRRRRRQAGSARLYFTGNGIPDAELAVDPRRITCASSTSQDPHDAPDVSAAKRSATAAAKGQRRAQRFRPGRHRRDEPIASSPTALGWRTSLESAQVSQSRWWPAHDGRSCTAHSQQARQIIRPPTAASMSALLHFVVFA